jgi:hypothetical protein
MSDWPKITVFYLHSDKETNYEKAKELGLSPEATKQFAYACYEVGIMVEVNEDGSCQAMGIEGRLLQQKVPV